MNICSIDDCGKSVLARGYCSRHYNAWRKHGDPLKRILAERGSHAKWLAKTSKAETDDCIIWPFKSKYRKGYGMTWFKGRPTGAHRAVCIIVKGEPAPGTECAHSCGNAACANPRHLRWATPAENQSDKIVHGTKTIGENNSQAKLTESDVFTIRSLLGSHTQRAIAEQFGVSRELISAISRGLVWKHIDGAAA